jgi:hypothetical protein
MRMQQRGRAIVRRLGTHEDRRTFRPGDFLLVRTTGALPGIEGLATGGALNHAALIADASGALIEVNPHLRIGVHPLRRAHVRDYLDAGAPCWIGYVEVQEGTRLAVVEFAESLLAAPARLGALGATALTLHALLGVAPRARTARHAWLRPLHPFFDRYALVLREEHTYLSGELVARALERGGFVWDCDPAYVTASVLFERFCLEQTPERGVLVPLAAARKSKERLRGKAKGAADASPTRRPSGPARVSFFPPRAAAPGAPGAEPAGGPGLAATHQSVAPAWEAAPLSFPAPAPNGVRTLLQLALLTAGSLALVQAIESLARQRVRP